MAMPCASTASHQVEQPLQRVEVGRAVGDLRADVAVDAGHREAGQRARHAGRRPARARARCRTCCRAGRSRCRDASSASTSGLTRRLMRAVRPAATATCDSTSSSASLSTLKHSTPASSAARISARVLPTPEKTVLAALAAGGEHAAQLAARDDVEAATRARQGLQHRQVGVRLQRVADEVLAPGERALVARQRLEHRAARIDIQRRAEAVGQRVEAAAFEPQRVAAIGELRCAGKTRHRDALAAEAAGCSAGGGVNGPFCPQPARSSSASNEPTASVGFATCAARPLATLGCTSIGALSDHAFDSTD